MPKITSNEYKYVDDNGTDQTLKVAFEANSSGDFFAVIPDWLEDNAAAIARNFDTFVGRPKVHLRIEGKRLIDVQNTVSVALREYSKPDVSNELVIRYVVSSQLSTWEMPDGSLAPNGTVADQIYAEKEGKHGKRGEEGYGDWVNFRHGLNANERVRGGFSVTIGAAVFRKTTSVRGSFTAVTYQKAEGMARGNTRQIYMLNSFVGFDMDDTRAWPRHLTLEEMPYTPEAAEFFYSMLIGISGLALKLERFFTDKDKLLAFIESGQQLLPAPGR